MTALRRAANARRIAAAAAVGGAVGGVGLASAGVLFAEMLLARREIGVRTKSAPYADGRYGDGEGTSLRLVMLGDSGAAGLGADLPEETPGAILAAGLAAASGRPVRYLCMATVGARSADLAEQVERAKLVAPNAAVIMIGANDVTHRVPPARSVQLLSEAVAALRASGTEVVVGTCPDLGSVGPIRPPLRWVARRLSRQLAAAQAMGAVVEGGRAVSLGALLGPEFAARRDELFAPDQFHPSSRGYAAVAEAMLPSLLEALGYAPAEEPVAGRTLALAEAAVVAADTAGTEVTGTGGWARARRLARFPLPRLAPPAPLEELTSNDAAPTAAS